MRRGHRRADTLPPPDAPGHAGRVPPAPRSGPDAEPSPPCARGFSGAAAHHHAAEAAPATGIALASPASESRNGGVGSKRRSHRSTAAKSRLPFRESSRPSPRRPAPPASMSAAHRIFRPVAFSALNPRRRAGRHRAAPISAGRATRWWRPPSGARPACSRGDGRDRGAGVSTVTRSRRKQGGARHTLRRPREEGATAEEERFTASAPHETRRPEARRDPRGR